MWFRLNPLLEGKKTVPVIQISSDQKHFGPCERITVHGFPLARMFTSLFSKATCSRCVELIVALPCCIRKVTLHCIPATQHDEGNQK